MIFTPEIKWGVLLMLAAQFMDWHVAHVVLALYTLYQLQRDFP